MTSSIAAHWKNALSMPIKTLLLAMILSLLGIQESYAIWGLSFNTQFVTPRARHGMDVYPSYGLAPTGGTQYVMLFGGMNQAGQPLNSVELGVGQEWVYTYGGSFGAGPTWFAGAPMPTARFGLQAVTLLNGLCYVMGGSNGSSVLNTVEIYNPLTNTWTNGAPMLTPRMDFGAKMYNGKIYVIGGYGASGPLSSVECFDPATGVWTALNSMPTPRTGLILYGSNFYSNGGYIFAAGGQTTLPVAIPNVTPLSVVEKYDISTGIWTTELPMSSPRSYGTSGFEDGSFHAIVGGYGPAGLPSPYVMGVPYVTNPPSPFSLVVTDSVEFFGTLIPMAETNSANGVGAYEWIHGFTGGRDINGNVLNTSFTALHIIALNNEQLTIEATLTGNAVALHGVIESGGEWAEIWFERSFDGEEFLRIGDPQRFSPSTLDTGYREQDILVASTVHYRMVASKLDGSISYSNILSLQGSPSIELSFHPNPVSTLGTLTIQGIEPGESIQYELFDVNGRQLLKEALQYTDAKTVDLSEISNGTYFLKVRTGEIEKILRVIRN